MYLLATAISGHFSPVGVMRRRLLYLGCDGEGDDRRVPRGGSISNVHVFTYSAVLHKTCAGQCVHVYVCSRPFLFHCFTLFPLEFVLVFVPFHFSLQFAVPLYVSVFYLIHSSSFLQLVFSLFLSWNAGIS